MDTNNRKKATIVTLCLLLVFSLFAVIPKAEAATVKLKVTANALNVRNAPTTSKSRVLFSIKKNTVVTKLAKKGSWYKVKYKNKTGWASATYLKVVKQTLQPLSNTTKVVLSKTNDLNIRKSNTTSSTIVGKMQKGESATYKAKKGDWVQISKGSITGWVNAAYVTISTKPSLTAAAANYYFAVTANSLSVRAEPYADSKLLTYVKKNESLLISRIASNGWIEVTYKTGKKGWVLSKYGKQQKKEPITNSVTIVVPEQTTYYYITEPTGLTIRNSYSVNAKSLGQTIPNETKVQILKQASNGWIYVKYNDVEGWINGSSYYGFASIENISFTSSIPSKTSYFVMKADTLNIRSLPSTVAPTLGKASKGNYFKILRISSNNWVQVQYNSKQKGWISANTSSSTITTKKPTTSVSNPLKGSLTGLKIVVDAGHGKQDSGAVGNGVYEKTLNLYAARAVRDAIQAVGGTVSMTRNSDNEFLTLDQRSFYAAKVGANAFISVHHNSGPAAASGYESYYTSSAKVSSYNFAKIINDEITKAIKDEYPNYNIRKANNSALKDKSLQVTRVNSVVSILLELGFVSNKDDVKLVNTDDFRETVAEGVVNGLLIYFGRNK